MVKDIKPSLISFFSTTTLALIVEESGEEKKTERETFITEKRE